MTSGNTSPATKNNSITKKIVPETRGCDSKSAIWSMFSAFLEGAFHYNILWIAFTYYSMPLDFFSFFFFYMRPNYGWTSQVNTEKISIFSVFCGGVGASMIKYNNPILAVQLVTFLTKG